MAGNSVNEQGNVPRRGVVPRFSDIEVVALNITSEATGLDSESCLFDRLKEYRKDIPNYCCPVKIKTVQKKRQEHL